MQPNDLAALVAPGLLLVAILVLWIRHELRNPDELRTILPPPGDPVGPEAQNVAPDSGRDREWLERRVEEQRLRRIK